MDQHELLALMAPRAVYVASASNDAWADPQGEFLSAVHAASVYQLFGFAGLGTEQFPAAGQHIHGQQIGYHLRQGDHDLTRFDWDLYMDFFDTVQVLPNDDPTPAGGAANAGANVGGAAGMRDDTGVGGSVRPGSGGMAGELGNGGTETRGLVPGATPSGPRPDSGAGCGCRVAQRASVPSSVALLLALGAMAGAIGRRAVGRSKAS